MYECVPGYSIPCDKTVKNIICGAYNWTHTQMIELIKNTTQTINLTTDLWTAKSKHGYLGITATWLDSNFKFREALLSCQYLPYPHTSEVIKDELKKVIQIWNLDSKLFTIVTDNGANMIKACRLLGEEFKSIKRLPCAAHTLQLSVQAGIKQIEIIHKRLKNLQTFFRSPKHAQQLRDAQKTIMQQNQDDIDQWELLDILTDCKTRWNSTYYAWKRIIKLDDAIRSLAATLCSSQIAQVRKEGEHLNKLRLNSEEFR